MHHPKIDRFIAYWNERRGDRAMPAKRDIDPVDIPTLLPHLILYEVVSGDPPDFLCRLVGEHPKANYGRCIRGSLLSEQVAANPTVGRFRDNFLRCIEERAPVLVTDSFVGATGAPKTAFGAVAPLSPDGERVTMILCCSVYMVRNGDRWTESNSL